MATYLMLNLVFAAVIVGMLLLAKGFHISRRHLVVLLVLVVCTALFDSLIILADIVRYDSQKILGVYIGSAPVEDFFYALLAVIVVPNIWNILAKKRPIKNEARHE